MVYIHNGILFSHKVESNCDVCRKMDGTGVCHVKWNKTDSERPSSHVFSIILKTDPKDKHIHSANMIINDIIIFLMCFLLCIFIDEL
jgi:hypothetical protein